MKIDNYDMVLGLRDAIRPLHDAGGSFWNDHLEKSFPNAPAAREIAAYNDPEVVGNAFSQGGVLIEVAVDHVSAFLKTVTEPVETFAPWVCVRSVLEASAIASWLLTPDINAEERAKRSFAFRYEGLSQSVMFMRAAKINQSEIDDKLKRIVEVENQAVACGLERLVDKKLKRNGIGMQMPKVTELVKQVFDDESTYRLLSGMAHAHNWALLNLSYTLYEQDDGKSASVKMKKQVVAQSY